MGYMVLLGIAVILWILMLVRIFKSSVVMGILSFLFFPLALIPLIQNWGDEELDIKLPFFGCLIAYGLVFFLAFEEVKERLGGSMAEQMVVATTPAGDTVVVPMSEAFVLMERGGDIVEMLEMNDPRALAARGEVPDRTTGTSRSAAPAYSEETGEDLSIEVPVAKPSRAGITEPPENNLPDWDDVVDRLPFQRRNVRLAHSYTNIDIPQHFRFVDRPALRDLFYARGRGLPDAVSGLIVHESVELRSQDPWLVLIRWLPIGNVAADRANRWNTAEMLDAAQRQGRLRRATGLAADQGSVTLAGFVEAPVFDTASQRLTWVERLDPLSGGEPRLDCHAVRLARRGVLWFTIESIAASRQELCLRTVRLMADRAVFDERYRHRDYNSTTDRKAEKSINQLVEQALTGLP